ncbi:MAG: hypothetical protein ACJ790_11920 [Myxococcaceae bacterium]
MRYDLLIQSADPQVPFDAAAVEKVLATKTLTTLPDGTRRWSLKNGDVDVQPLKEGGVLIATQIRVPLSDRLELIREAVVESAYVASEAKARLFDPQLTRTLTTADEAVVADQYLRTAKYAGEMMGVSEAISASFEAPREGMSVGTKVVIGLIALGILVWFVTEKLLGALTAQ